MMAELRRRSTSVVIETEQHTMFKRQLIDLPRRSIQARGEYINGLSLPDEIDRSSSAFRAPKHIAAIDFGTTGCSLAYSFQDDDRIKPVKLDNHDTRVPTAILFDENGEVISFGKDASRKYAALSKDKKKQHYFFHRIKMALQHDEKVNWHNVAKAVNGKEFFLVEIIAMILKHVKNRLLNIELEKSTEGVLKASDFDWVITVPAMWKARGKQLMREAAYKAGIACEGDGITKLTPVEKIGDHFTTCPPKIDHSILTPEALSLALEPEAAALDCLQRARKQNAKCADSKCYMVLDIGGGTVDISAHKTVQSGAVEVILPPTGNDYGGTRINDEFKHFLGELIDDPKFEEYLQTGNTTKDLKNSADLDAIINQRFEEQKQFFGDKGPCDEEALIELPFSFMIAYGNALDEGIERLNDQRISLSGSELVISYYKMEEFFHVPLAETISCVIDSFDKVVDEVDTVFFVGGFGGCKYVHERIEAAIKEHHSKKTCNFYRPPYHIMSVVTGAVIFRKNPEVVQSRVADATYGSACSQKYNSLLHDEAYRFYDDDRNPRCNHLFLPFVLRGDKLSADKLLTTSYSPLSHDQQGMTFSIYSSKKNDMKYVSTPRGEPLADICRIGSLQVNMPDKTGDKSRKVKLTFDFSHTEIQIEAFDVTSGEKATTTVDFLTDL